MFTLNLILYRLAAVGEIRYESVFVSNENVKNYGAGFPKHD